MRSLTIFIFFLLFVLLSGCSSSSTDSSTTYVTLSVSEDSVTESDTSLYIIAELTETLSEVSTINLTFSGTATFNTDYTISDIQIIIPTDDISANVALTILDDTDIESSETIIVDIESILPIDVMDDGEQSQIITLVDDDVSSNVSISTSQPAISEAGDQAILTVSLIAELTQNVYITLSLGSDTDATLGSDFLLGDTDLTIDAGSLYVTTSVSSIADDDSDENLETVSIEIDTVTNAEEDGDQVVEIHIVDESYDFITIWETTAENETIEIGLYDGLDYEFSINWGDGTFDYVTGDAISSIDHEYDEISSNIEISITPLVVDNDIDSTEALTGFPSIYLYNSDTADHLLDISQWGKSRWETMNRAFSGAQNLSLISATDRPDFTDVTSLSYMFYNAASFNVDISDWDTSTIQDMSGLFSNASSFQQDISGLDTSSVTNMSQMFSYATSFNVDLSALDISSVWNMSYMFYQASAFNQDLSDWDTSGVEDMSFMFSYASSFNADISGWNTSSVTNMASMFSHAGDFNQDLSSWDISNVINMSQMFSYTESFNSDLSNWDTSSVTNMNYMFLYSTAFNQDVSDWDTSSVTSMDMMFYLATVFNQDLSDWDISSLESMGSIFKSSALSTCNYSESLKGWATLSSDETAIPTGISLSNSIAYSSDAATYVSSLQDDYSWTISDSEDSGLTCF